MLIQRLEVEGLFSFGSGDRRFELDLDEGLTVIVGPNAAGKTNLGRALGLLQTALRYQEADRPDRETLYLVLDDHVRSGRHRGMASATSSLVRVRLKLTSQAEVSQLVSFVQTAVLSSLIGNMGNSGGDLTPLEDWVATGVSAVELSSLQQGTITVSHTGIPGTGWEVAYEFDHEGTALTWHLASSHPNLANALTSRDFEVDGPPPTVVTVCQRLTGNHPGSGPQPPAPPTEPFSLSSILPTEDNVVLVVSEMVNWQPAPTAIRAFLAAAGIVAPSLNPQEPLNRRYTLGGVLSRILDRALVLSHPSEDQIDKAVRGSGGRTYPAPILTRPLAGHGLPNLPARLFQLMNGDHAAQQRYWAVQQLFTKFAPGRRFELTSDHRASGDEAGVLVDIQINIMEDGASAGSPVLTPIQFAGTGVEQALVLAETIANSADQVLVLDEPAVNLHPPWQRLIRSRMGSGPGQFVVVTHSPYLVPTESLKELAYVVRFGLQQGATHPYRLPKAELSDSQRFGGWIRELAGSADARGLLFAAGVVLVEGETELGALPTWFAKSANAKRYRAPGDLHLAFYCVGGDKGFKLLISYLDRFGVPWAVVCDGAAFRVDRPDNILVQVLDAVVDDPQLKEFVIREKIPDPNHAEMEEQRFRSLVTEGASHGVFSLASGWQRRSEPAGDRESFEAYLRSDTALSAACDQASLDFSLAPADDARTAAGG